MAGPGRRPHPALPLNIIVYFHVEPCLESQRCGKQRDLPDSVREVIVIQGKRTVDTEGRSVEGSDLVGQGLRNLSQGGLTGAKVTPNQRGTLRPLLADELTTSQDSTSQENLFRTTINRNPDSNSEAKFRRRNSSMPGRNSGPKAAVFKLRVAIPTEGGPTDPSTELT